jgi:hypothetical protein
MHQQGEGSVMTRRWQEPEEDAKFDAWIETLEVDVIQGEYGYERGEFSVFPELWWPLYERGLSPSQAFAHALEAHREARGE